MHIYVQTCVMDKFGMLSGMAAMEWRENNGTYRPIDLRFMLSKPSIEMHSCGAVVCARLCTGETDHVICRVNVGKWDYNSSYAQATYFYYSERSYRERFKRGKSWNCFYEWYHNYHATRKIEDLIPQFLVCILVAYHNLDFGGLYTNFWISDKRWKIDRSICKDRNRATYLYLIQEICNYKFD